MQITIFDYKFVCPNCKNTYKETLEDECGISICPKCNHEFDWTVGINIQE